MFCAEKVDVISFAFERVKNGEKEITTCDVVGVAEFDLPGGLRSKLDSRGEVRRKWSELRDRKKVKRKNPEVARR